jgi:hypothetical protein
MNILIVICSKSPNPHLYNCIDNLYKIQIKNNSNYKICVVDSDSNDLTNYRKIKTKFPHVQVCFIKNKNYEYGAWKHALKIYPNYDIYFCIQDTNIIKNNINLDIINNNTVYTFHHNTGYYSHPEIKEEGKKLLENSGLDFESLIDTNFTLAQHSIFIVNNYIMKDIFMTLINPPINKAGSCIYERNFGLYFLIKKINTIDLIKYMDKIHGKRY